MTLERGSALGPRPVAAVNPSAMRTVAEILADPNPIHLDGSAARMAGLGDRPVNQGPASFGYVLDMLRESLPDADLVQFEVRLVGNVFEGDRPIAGGRVEDIEDSADGTLVRCTVWLDVDGGARALDGTATLVLRPPGPRRRPH